MKNHSPGFLKVVNAAKARVTETSVEEVLKRQAEGVQFHFLDVREDLEYQGRFCRGARHLSKGILERDIEERVPDKAAEIVLYCGGGFRSALAADSLQNMGYSKVYSMSGGFRAWLDAKAPVERP